MERRLRNIFHRPKQKLEVSLAPRQEYDTAISAVSHRHNGHHEDVSLSTTDDTAQLIQSRLIGDKKAPEDQDTDLSKEFKQLELEDKYRQRILELEKNTQNHGVAGPSKGRERDPNGPPHAAKEPRQRVETKRFTRSLAASSSSPKAARYSRSPQTSLRHESTDAEVLRPRTTYNQSKSGLASKKRSLPVEDAKITIPLDGVVDLQNSEDTTVNTRWAPAVTHQTVHKDVHHIREEHITREIHTHDYFHRILPIVDVEVLPPRHFIPSATNPAQLVEVPGNAIPGRRDDDDQKMRHWFIAREVEEHAGGQAESTTRPRTFTAREFRDGDGDHHEWIGEDDVKRSTTTWIHPPTIESGGQKTGQTVPFHLGSADPSQDGFRAEDFPDSYE